jgi:hypothetical protein
MHVPEHHLPMRVILRLSGSPRSRSAGHNGPNHPNLLLRRGPRPWAALLVSITAHSLLGITLAMTGQLKHVSLPAKGILTLAGRPHTVTRVPAHLFWSGSLLVPADTQMSLAGVPRPFRLPDLLRAEQPDLRTPQAEPKSAPLVPVVHEYPAFNLLGGTVLDMVKLAVFRGFSPPALTVDTPPESTQEVMTDPEEDVGLRTLPETTVPSLSRVDHPRNGGFDVVIVQTSPEALLPEGNETMSCQPVYTVYLHVGDRQEWVLYYCAADARTVQSGNVVTLGDPRPLTAPYPRTSFLPERMPVSGTERLVFIHGLIDEKGRVRNPRVLGEKISDCEPLLEALMLWRFRPARRGPEAARVEVVLAVPSRRS